MQYPEPVHGVQPRDVCVVTQEFSFIFVHLQVMKCIVEALADVLSRPHPVPVSQECLTTLRTGE